MYRKMFTLSFQSTVTCSFMFSICFFYYFRLNVLRVKTAVQINSAANSAISANSVLMVLDVLMMTSVVAKKFANLEVVKLNQVRIRNKVDILENVSVLLNTLKRKRVQTLFLL